MNKKTLILTFLAAMTLVLAACGGGEAAPAEENAIGDVKAGETLFAEPIIGAQPGCSTCHSLDADLVIVGPSLAGIATRAETRVEGLNAEEYIRQSILEPDAYINEGFTAGVMVQVWAQELSEEQVDNLVAFLLTQK